MEELSDDDFSDLYAEVEVQASSAIGAMHGLTEMPPPEHRKDSGNVCHQSSCDDEELLESIQNATGREEVVNEFVEIEAAAGECADVVDWEEEEEESGGGLGKLVLEDGDIYESDSDSEDDINIVLDGGNDGNRGRCGNSKINKYEFGAHEKKNGRINGNYDKCCSRGDYDSRRKSNVTQSVAPSSNSKGNAPTRTGQEDNGCGHLIDEIPVASRSARSFSLPRSRTILDVNIDSLERKPWRHPTSDITDFFNFGFDEDGWKCYCNDLDKCRGIKMMANRIPAPEYPRRAKKYEVGSGHDKDFQDSYAKNAANPKQKKREPSTSKKCHGYHLPELILHTVLPRDGLLSEYYEGKHQPSSHERHSDDQDSDVVVHDSKGDSHYSNKKTANDIVNQVDGPSKNGDSDVDIEMDPCFSSASEDDPPLRRNEDQRVKFSSKRDSRHTLIRALVSSNLDEYGTVQISDSKEYDHNEVFGNDSDGKAEVSDDTNRENAGKMSNKASSAVERKLSLSRRSHHGMGFCGSPSPHAAFRNSDRKKSSEQSKKYLSSRVRKLQESAISDLYSSRASKHHAVKPSTRNDTYRGRDRRPTRKDLKPYRTARRVHDSETRLNDDYVSEMLDGRGFCGIYKSRTSPGKQGATPSFDFNEIDMQYCRDSESLSNYSGEFFPEHQWGPAYLKGQSRNAHPRFRCAEGWDDDQRMVNNGNSFQKRTTRMEYDIEDIWCPDEKRRAIQDMNPLNFEDSRKFIPKYSDDRRRNRFIERHEGLQFRRETRGYVSSYDYNNDFTKGNQRSYRLSSDQDRVHFEHIYDRDMLRDRKEIESPPRGESRQDSPRNNSNHLWHTKDDENRRCIKHRSLSFRSYECHAPSMGEFPGAAAPTFVASERHLRSSWKDRRRESGWCGSNNAFSEISDSLKCANRKGHHVGRRHFQQPRYMSKGRECIENHHEWDHFVRRRNHEHFEVLQWSEEEYRSRYPIDTVFSYEGPSYHLEEISWKNRSEYGYASDCVAEGFDEREVGSYRYKLKRERDCTSKFVQSPKVISPDSHVHIHARHGDSVEPRSVVREKSTRRTSEAEDSAYCNRYDIVEQNNYRDSRSYEDMHDFDSEKIVLVREEKVCTKQSEKIRDHKFSDNQQNKFLDIEEGQIITEEINEKPLQCLSASEDVRQINVMERPETASNGNRVVERLGDQRIQEIMAKMERRRERFAEPVNSNWDSENNSMHFADLDVEAAECKQERPMRKRRWGVGGW